MRKRPERNNAIIELKNQVEFFKTNMTEKKGDLEFSDRILSEFVNGNDVIDITASIGRILDPSGKILYEIDYDNIFDSSNEMKIISQALKGFMYYKENENQKWFNSELEKLKLPADIDVKGDLQLIKQLVLFHYFKSIHALRVFNMSSSNLFFLARMLDKFEKAKIQINLERVRNEARRQK